MTLPSYQGTNSPPTVASRRLQPPSPRHPHGPGMLGALSCREQRPLFAHTKRGSHVTCEPPEQGKLCTGAVWWGLVACPRQLPVTPSPTSTPPTPRPALGQSGGALPCAQLL